MSDEFKPGQCPSCKHKQHVGLMCEQEIYSYSEAQELGLPGNIHIPVRCGCLPEKAIKADTGKPHGFRLFPWEVLPEILDVYHYGISKGYLPDSWRQVPPRKYEDALVRHMIEFLKGHERDAESGKRVLAHLAWNVITLLVLTPEE